MYFTQKTARNSKSQIRWLRERSGTKDSADRHHQVKGSAFSLFEFRPGRRGTVREEDERGGDESFGPLEPCRRRYL